MQNFSGIDKKEWLFCAFGSLWFDLSNIVPDKPQFIS